MECRRGPKLKKLKPHIHHFSSNPCLNQCKVKFFFSWNINNYRARSLLPSFDIKFQQVLSICEAHMAMHPKFPIKNRGRQPRKQSVKNENTKKNKKNEKEPMKAPFQISFNGLRLVGGE